MKCRRFALSLLGGLVLLLPSSARAQAPAAAPPAEPLAATDVGLRPGDLLRLRIWREPDLSGDFSVDEHGIVVLPRLGPMSVLGVSVDSLRARLVERYGTYLRNPSIDVIPLRRVQVLGFVKVPGLYPSDATLTVADVIALAGGVTPEGSADAVRLLRDGKEVPGKLSLTTRIADTPVRSGDQIYVGQRSWSARNPALVPALISGLFSMAVSLIIVKH